MDIYQTIIKKIVLIPALLSLAGCYSITSPNPPGNTETQSQIHQIAPGNVSDSVSEGIGVAFGDMNSDGEEDILTAGPYQGLLYYKNLGNNTYASPIKIADIPGEAYNAGIGIAIRDMDEDKDLDIILVGPQKGINWIENQGQFK